MSLSKPYNSLSFLWLHQWAPLGYLLASYQCRPERFQLFSYDQCRPEQVLLFAYDPCRSERFLLIRYCCHPVGVVLISFLCEPERYMLVPRALLPLAQSCCSLGRAYSVVVVVVVAFAVFLFVVLYSVPRSFLYLVPRSWSLLRNHTSLSVLLKHWVNIAGPLEQAFHLQDLLRHLCGSTDTSEDVLRSTVS